MEATQSNLRNIFKIKYAILFFCFINLCIGNSQPLTGAHQVLGPPATTLMRGLFIDCTDQIVTDMYNGNFTSKNNLISYLQTNQIGYIALYRLDNNRVIGQPTLEPKLRTLLNDIRLARSGIQIGAIGSTRTFFEASPFLNVTSYLAHLCDVQSSTVNNFDQLNSMVNPTNPSQEQVQKSELLKFFLKAGQFETTTTNGLTSFSTNAAPNPPPPVDCNKAFDFLYLESEYWGLPTFQAKQIGYNDMRDILSVMQHIKCNSACIKNIDAEFNPQLIVNGTTQWTSLSQIQGIDPLTDRVTIPSYVNRNNAANTFDWKCHTYFEMAGGTTKKRSQIFVQLSAEKIGWTNCDGTITNTFLGPYLNGDAGGSTGNMYSVEKAFYDKYQNSSFICPNCGCTTYTQNHYSSSNLYGNEILGSIWFTYTIMKNNNLTRLASAENLTSDKVAKSINVWPTLITNSTTIRSEGTALNKVQLYDLAGKLIYSKDINNIASELDIDFTSFHSGFYILTVIDEYGEFYKTKIQVSK